MKKKIIAAVLALTCVLTNAVFAISANAETTGATYFVAQDGKDENPGTIDAPFATIEKARDSIRELKKSSGLPDGGVTVYVKEGTYRVTKEIDFTEEDSGTEESPIVYKAMGDKKPQIIGGVVLEGKNFKRITKDDANYERLQTSQAKKNVRTIDLNDYLTPEEYSGKFMCRDKEYDAWASGGRGNFGGLPGVEVYYNGNAMDAARWPNRASNGENVYTSFSSLVTKQEGTFPAKGAVYTYGDKRVENYLTTKNAAIKNVTGYWSESSSFKIDKSQGQILVDYGGEYEFHWGSGITYYYANVFEELDQAGEYYVDADTGILYLYGDNDMKDAEVRVATFGKTAADALIKLDKTSNVTFSGFDISLSRANGIFVLSGKNITFINCDISNIGLTGIQDGDPSSDDHYGPQLRGRGYGFYKYDCGKDVYLEGAGYNHNYVNSHIFNIGMQGVIIRAGDRIDLDPANHNVYNCEINNTGRFDASYGSGIEAIGVGINIKNNTIHAIPYTAINYGLNDSVIEYNDIYDCMNEGNDMGVLYSASYSASICAGLEIRYNYFHDIPNVITSSGGRADGESVGSIGSVAMRPAIYPDDGKPFQEMHHNIFANLPYGILIHGGAENNTNNNIFINVDKPIWFKAGNTYIPEGYAKGGIEGMWEILSGTEYKYLDNPMWREKHPEVFEVRDALEARPETAGYGGSDCKGNYSVFYENADKCNDELGPATQFSRIENNTFTKSLAGFTDIKNGDYSFSENSEVFKVNPELESIDIKRIGCDKNKTAEIVNGAVVLKIGTPNAIVFGKSKMVDGQNPDVQPVITDSRTLVPARFISESFGGEVTWNGDTREVGINLNGTEIKMTLDKAEYTINGEAKTLDVPAQSVNGRTLVPLRALVEALGKDVFWDERGLIVISNEKGLIEKENDKETIDYLVKYTPAY